MIGGLGPQELIIVLVIALFVFGGKRLPEVGQSLGKALRGFKEGTEGKEEEKEKAIDEEAEAKREADEPAKEEQTSETPPSDSTDPEEKKSPVSDA